MFHGYIKNEDPGFVEKSYRAGFFHIIIFQWRSVALEGENKIINKIKLENTAGL
jgi:hypothetical protein